MKTQHVNHKTVVIAAGGTGGHVFPAVVLAQECHRRGYKVHFVTDQRGQAYIPPSEAFSVYSLPFSGGSGGWCSKIQEILKLGRICLSHIKHLKRWNPDCIVGFGGYASFPTLFAGVCLRYPFILHEQNAVAGKVNRWFARWARFIALSFSQTQKLPSSSLARQVLTGLPVRETIAQRALQRYKPPQDSLHLLVLGGSQGAQIFGEILPQALKLLPPATRQHISVTHQCRPDKVAEVQAFYESLRVKAQCAGFFEGMSQCLAAAHLVIARSGASTVSELKISGRPALLVPYPSAADNHQFFNALEIDQVGGGWLIPQPQFTAPLLAKFLQDVIAHPNTLLAASEASRSLAHPNASSLLTDLVDQLLLS